MFIVNRVYRCAPKSPAFLRVSQQAYWVVDDTQIPSPQSARMFRLLVRVMFWGSLQVDGGVGDW